MLRINFDPATYTVGEGSVADLMLVLSAPSDAEVTVVVRTNPGTAVGACSLAEGDIIVVILGWL